MSVNSAGGGQIKVEGLGWTTRNDKEKSQQETWKHSLLHPTTIYSIIQFVLPTPIFHPRRTGQTLESSYWCEMVPVVGACGWEVGMVLTASNIPYTPFFCDFMLTLGHRAFWLPIQYCAVGEYNLLRIRLAFSLFRFCAEQIPCLCVCVCRCLVWYHTPHTRTRVYMYYMAPITTQTNISSSSSSSF